MAGNPMFDRDQLQPEDTLVEAPTGDVLDSGYEPADSARGRLFDETVREAGREETIEERLAQEVPEDPDLPGQPLRRPAPGARTVLDESLVTDQSPDEEAELVAETDGPVIDASPEEGAMHVIEEDRAP